MKTRTMNGTRLVWLFVEQVFGVDYTLTFAAVMDLGTVKLIVILFKRWNSPACQGDVPNVYDKAEKEDRLDIYMKVSKGMILEEKVLKVREVTGHDGRLADEGTADAEDEGIASHV